MKTPVQRLREQLQKPFDQPIAEVSIRLPQRALDDLIEIAPMLGCHSYRGVIKLYISQGLRKDLQRLPGTQAAVLTESLRNRGMKDSDISTVIEEARLKTE